MRGMSLMAALAAMMLSSPANAQSKDDVALVQFYLHSLGYDAGAVDGLWGGTTRNALAQFFEASGADFDGKLDEAAIDFVSRAFDALPKGGYVNQTAHFDTMAAQNYEVFPYKEIACRAVFQAPWVGFDDIAVIQDFLAQSRCDNIWYQGAQYSLGDAIEGGVKLDIDDDGTRDLLVFLYGFQLNNPLTVLAFKLSYDPVDYLDLPLDQRVSPIERIFAPEEVFAAGEYPLVQSARFVSVADFNNDGKEDIFISDGGYDGRGNQRSYPSKIFYSSPNGFVEEEVTRERKSHGADAADINGDGYVDIVMGSARSGLTAKGWDSSRLLLNQQGQGFLDATALLPKSLQEAGDSQPAYVGLFDVDGDGYVDIVAGKKCGRQSMVFWNDGRGVFSDDNATVVPLDYSSTSSDCSKGTPTTVAQAFVVSETRTSEKYLGIWSGKGWNGRYLTLHRVDGRSLSEDVAKVPADKLQSKTPSDFAYAMSLAEHDDGHVIDVFDLTFRRTRLVFDPQTETYRIDVRNHEQNYRWTYDVDAVIGAR